MNILDNKEEKNKEIQEKNTNNARKVLEIINQNKKSKEENGEER